MAERLDICTPRASRDGKTYWTKIGTAWKGDKGIQLVFDALGQGGFTPAPRNTRQDDDLGGDSIPF